VGVAAEAQLERLVALFAALPQVEAVSLGGSRASGRADDASDFDVYVHADDVIPLETRRRFVEQLGGASVADLGLDYFGDGDEWLDARTEARFDVIYFGLEWMKNQVERPLVHHQPSLGYSTAFAYTVSRARIMHDPDGTFATLQTVTLEPYPEALREAVVRYNHPMLRGTISSYREQLEKAAARQDIVSLNHRLAALLASYFDIIFAVNRALHPGEKRLVATALETCPSLPDNFESDVTETLSAAGDGARLLPALTRLLNALDGWLVREGFDVTALRPVHIPAG
jgi:predicted nucleotidyltransferase